ncbi:MAG: hypothetical protein M1817_005255 [Caeruleum heppii]|nr:MAG: hypothetical protein M1817_005255 [Caeruleum heppii]
MRAGTVIYATLLGLLASPSRAIKLAGRDLNAELLPSYDYIIVGGGISGLVVGNRLDNYEEFIQVPQFVGSDVGSKYDWRLGTVPQTYLDGAARPFPQGKALGGGSILNAMCWNRGGSDDFDSWRELGNPGWDWQGLLPYFIKSETYTPVFSEDIARRFSINYNPAVHGFDGPVQVGYPKYFYNQSINFFAALNELGVPTQFDPNDGTSAGAAFIPTDLDPNNQTRSDARRTYWDPYVNRPNFHIITGQQVTRINIAGFEGNPVSGIPTTGGSVDGEGSNPGLGDGGLFGDGSTNPPDTADGTETTRSAARQLPEGLRITGIEFAPNATAQRTNVSMTREVIVCAGALHSPQLLQLSGIGSRKLLETYGIPSAVDLPGVGNNMQDHYLVGTFYPYNNVSDSPARLTQDPIYNAQARDEYNSMKTGPWTAGSPNGVAFPSLPSASNISTDLLQRAYNQDPADYLLEGLDPSIIAGYAAQKTSLVRSLLNDNVAAWEIINNNVGSLTVAIMHPFSRGSCNINSPNPFMPPSIDPRYGSNPVDLDILVEALRFNRRILATAPMVELQPAQFVPPADADDATLLQVVKNGIRTEYHPSGTCAMLPREQGGVVDPRLRVYGTQNLRVIDASIHPLVPAAHLQASVYAVAEKGADIVKEDNVDVMPSPASSALSSSQSSTSTVAGSSSSSSTNPQSPQSSAAGSIGGSSSASTREILSGASPTSDLASPSASEPADRSPDGSSFESVSSAAVADGPSSTPSLEPSLSVDISSVVSILTSAAPMPSTEVPGTIDPPTEDSILSPESLTSLSSVVDSLISVLTSSEVASTPTLAELLIDVTQNTASVPSQGAATTVDFASSPSPSTLSVSAAASGSSNDLTPERRAAIAAFIDWLRRLLATFSR